MKKRWTRRVLILALAAALCLAMVLVTRVKERASTGRLTLWYAQEDFSPAVMGDLLARCRAATGLRIEATAFPEEESLGAAFENNRPDLLFCNHIRAASLAERDNLSGLPEALPFSESLRTAGEEIGTSFFPIGGRLPLLLTHTTESFETLEALLTAEGERPVLAGSCWSDLLFTACLSRGYWMQGVPETDSRYAVWQELFNSLAAAAFEQRLFPTKDAAAYVRQGSVPCAIVRSTELAGLTGDGLSLRLLPLPEGGEALYPGELMGFAVMEGAHLPAAQRFITWLFSGAEDGSAALAAGLVPVHAGAPERNGIEKSLMEIAMSGSVCFLAPDTAFYQNRAACEQRIAAALDLIA